MARQATGIERMVCADIAERQLMGRRKYGRTLAENPAERLERLQHAYEEALDLAVYLKWELVQTAEELARVAAVATGEGESCGAKPFAGGGGTVGKAGLNPPPVAAGITPNTP